MRGWNERNEVTAPRRVWGGNVNANHRPLLNGDCVNAGELADQIAEVRLVSDKKESFVAASGEELCDIGGSWAVSKVLVNRGGGFKRCSDHGAGLGAATRRRCAERSNVRTGGNERRRKSGGLLDPL
jgi:hypothetical protein